MRVWKPVWLPIAGNGVCAHRPADDRCRTVLFAGRLFAAMVLRLFDVMPVRPRGGVAVQRALAAGVLGLVRFYHG